MEENNLKIMLPGEVLASLKKVSARLRSLKAPDFVDSSLFEPSVSLLTRKRKLLRPTLVLIGAYAIGERTDKFVDLAVAAELLHTASLIHDDIIDRDTERRGSIAVHARYGNRVAIVAGDALISKAVGMAAAYGERVLKSITDASMEMCAGEALDYMYQKRRVVPSLREYTRIASLKSASLIGASYNAAAVYSSRKDSGVMYLAGKDLGIAFQIRDDIADFITSMKSGDKRVLIPNAVTSVQKNYEIGSYSAIMKTMQMNNQYIDKAVRRLSGGRAGKVFGEYAGLIRVGVV